MTGTTHSYGCTVTWTGNVGGGTATYTGYERAHLLTHPAKPAIPGSSDPSFLGDPSAWNPEELLVASLSQCHLLFFLHCAAVAGIIVEAYVDEPTGTMIDDHDRGHFTEVVLRPRVTVACPDMVDRCDQLHAEAHERCYIANSVSFPVRHEAHAAAAVT